MTINHSSVKGKEMDALRDKSTTQGISWIEGVGSSSPSRLEQLDITILGFQVKAQTWDDELQTDSKGDEVFVDYVVQLGDVSGKNQVSVHNQTDVMGDVNRQEGHE
jgi:hypothetical protein